MNRKGFLQRTTVFFLLATNIYQYVIIKSRPAEPTCAQHVVATEATSTDDHRTPNWNSGEQLMKFENAHSRCILAMKKFKAILPLEDTSCDEIHHLVGDLVNSGHLSTTRAATLLKAIQTWDFRWSSVLSDPSVKAPKLARASAESKLCTVYQQELRAQKTLGKPERWIYPVVETPHCDYIFQMIEKIQVYLFSVSFPEKTRIMENVWVLAEDVMLNKIPGDFVETGVWTGAMSILMTMITEVYSVLEARKVWACDSYEGLPAPEINRYKLDKGDKNFQRTYLAAGIELVKGNFEHFGLYEHDDAPRVEFIKGFFKDSMPVLKERLENRSIALLRLDGDMYSSTWEVLEALYPLLSPGGYVIIDDWDLIRARQACLDYRAKHGIKSKVMFPRPKDIVRNPKSGAYWQKSL